MPLLLLLQQKLFLEGRGLEHVTRAQVFRRHRMRLLVCHLERILENPRRSLTRRARPVNVRVQWLVLAPETGRRGHASRLLILDRAGRQRAGG